MTQKRLKYESPVKKSSEWIAESLNPFSIFVEVNVNYNLAFQRGVVLLMLVALLSPVYLKGLLEVMQKTNTF